MQLSKSNLDYFSYKFFAAEEKRLDNIIVALIEKNSMLVGRTTYGFMLAGKRYSHPHYSGVKEWIGLNLKLLQDSIRFETNKKKLDMDKQMILQFITKIANRCKTSEDFRNAIPECITSFFRLDGMQRTKEEGWIFSDNPREMAQFKKAADIMAFYSVSHLMQ